jgi:hypothetical protein
MKNNMTIKKPTFTFNGVYISKDREIFFEIPFKLIVTKKNNGWQGECVELKHICFGHTKELLAQSFAEDLKYMIEEFVYIKDELDNTAIMMKKIILKHLKRG